MKRLVSIIVGAVAAAAILAVNIGEPIARADAQGHAMTAMATSSTKASGLRSTLNTLFQEHIYPAADATGAALGGREAEFKAAAAALDANSVSISKAIGSVYGQGAEEAFLPLWGKPIGLVVEYQVGVATNDKAKQDKAVADLIGYTQDFGAFLQSANPNLPKSVVADLVKHHVVTLKEVIDAQASKDQAKTYLAMRTAAGHMQMIADPLAEAIVKQFPDKFGS